MRGPKRSDEDKADCHCRCGEGREQVPLRGHEQKRQGRQQGCDADGDFQAEDYHSA